MCLLNTCTSRQGGRRGGFSFRWHSLQRGCRTHPRAQVRQVPAGLNVVAFLNLSRVTGSWSLLAYLGVGKWSWPPPPLRKLFPQPGPEAAPEWVLSATPVENSNRGFPHTASVQGFSPWWLPLRSLYGRSLSPEWRCGCHGLMSTQANRIQRLPGKVSLTSMPFHFRICSLASGLDQYR